MESEKHLVGAMYLVYVLKERETVEIVLCHTLRDRISKKNINDCKFLQRVQGQWDKKIILDLTLEDNFRLLRERFQ